jgi:bacteriocin-like protein
MNSEICELSVEELEQVSGGDMLNMAIDAAEKYMAGVTRRCVRRNLGHVKNQHRLPSTG